MYTHEGENVFLLRRRQCQRRLQSIGYPLALGAHLQGAHIGEVYARAPTDDAQRTYRKVHEFATNVTAIRRRQHRFQLAFTIHMVERCAEFLYVAAPAHMSVERIVVRSLSMGQQRRMYA